MQTVGIQYKCELKTGWRRNGNNSRCENNFFIIFPSICWRVALFQSQVRVEGPFVSFEGRKKPWVFALSNYGAYGDISCARLATNMAQLLWSKFSKVQIRARLDCLTKPCEIIHMIVFSPKYLSDGIIRCLPCVSDVFIIMGNQNCYY